MTIYKILNKINGKIYIGQTCGPLRTRFIQHCAPKSGRYSAVTRAILKYGKENFSIEPLETCTSQYDLNQAERFWIETLKTLGPGGYNLKEGGSNGKLTLEIRQKIGAKARGRKRDDGGPMRGKTHTPETRAKISAASRGNRYALGTVHTQEFKDACKIRMAVRNQKQVIDLHSGFVFDSAEEAAESASMVYSTFVSRLNGSCKTPIHFCYVNKAISAQEALDPKEPPK